MTRGASDRSALAKDLDELRSVFSRGQSRGCVLREKSEVGASHSNQARGGRAEMNVQRERRIEWSRKSDSKLPGAERKFCISRLRTYSQIR